MYFQLSVSLSPSMTATAAFKFLFFVRVQVAGFLAYKIRLFVD